MPCHSDEPISRIAPHVMVAVYFYQVLLVDVSRISDLPDGTRLILC